MATSSGRNRPVGPVRRPSGARCARAYRLSQPLPRVGEDGPGAFGHVAEVDLRNRQYAAPDEADVELAAADVLLDEHFVELLRHGRDPRAQRLAVAHDGAAVEPRARVLGRRLDDGGQREVILDLALRDRPAGNGEPGLLEQGVRDWLPTARAEGSECGT